MNLNIISNKSGLLQINALVIKKLLLSYLKTEPNLIIEKKDIKIEISNDQWIATLQFKIKKTKNLLETHETLINRIIINIGKSILIKPNNLYFLFRFY